MADAGWRSPAVRIGGLGLVLLGAGLRVGLFAQARSFWSDEAKVALCVAGGTFTSLLGPLPHDQAAPIPFLFLERALFLLLGPGERGLRLPALVASVALLLAFRALVPRLTEPRIGLLALAAVAVSRLLVRYSVELKPYALDALFAVLLVALALDVLEGPDSSRAWRRLLVGGVIALVSSLPAVFVAGGVGAALLLSPDFRVRAGRVRVAVLAATWGTAFALIYALFYRFAAGHAYFARFWELRFLRPGAGFVSRARMAWGEVFSDLLHGRYQGLTGEALLLVMTLALVGLAVFARRNGAARTALVGAPTLALCAASALGLYPISPRLVLFAAPFWILLVAEGIGAVAGIVPRPAPRAAATAVLGMLLLALPFKRAVRLVTSPEREEDTRVAIRLLEARRGAGQPVYVFSRAVPPWAYYTTDWSAPDLARLAWYAELTSSTGRAFFNRPSRGGRVRPEEADGLVYPAAPGPELLGLFPGLEVAAGRSIARSAPDPGWADVEAARILGAARPDAWLFFAHFYENDRQVTDLIEALAARGARIRKAFFSPAARLLFVSAGGAGAGPGSGAPSRTVP